MKAKIYIGAKKYALYIGRKIVDTTLEFLTLPAKFVSKKVQVLKNIILYGNSVQSILPEEYAQLEYVECDGSQYIDTEYKPNSNTAVSIKYYPYENNVFMSLFGVQTSTSSNRFYALVSSTQFKLQINSLNAGQPNFYGINTNGTLQLSNNGDFNSNQEDVELTIDNKNKIVKINSNSYTGSINATSDFGNIDCSYPLILANRSTAGTVSSVNGFIGKIYSFKIWEDNVLINNYIPAQRKSDGIVGMYDTVSNTFFTNAGTGTFIAGSDTPTPQTPIEIESVGEKSKNLFRNTGQVIRNYSNGLSINLNKARLIMDCTANTGNYQTLRDFQMDLKANTPYTFSWTGTFENATLLLVTDNYTAKSSINQSSRTHTFTLTEDTTLFLAIRCTTPDIPTLADVNIQLEEGSQATEFVPYNEYKVPVEVRGKNLFDKDSVNIPKGWYDATTLQVGQPLPAPTSSSTFRMSDNIKVNPNETYYMVGIGGSSPSVLFLDKDLNFLEGFRNLNETKRLITVPNNADICYMRVPFAVATQDTAQLELGTKATSYQPYVEPVITNIYLNEPLRKVGDYADTMSIKGNEVTVVRNVKVVDETGDKPIKESLIHKVPSTTETYTIDNPIELQEGGLMIDVNTNIKPSKIELIGEVEYDN